MTVISTAYTALQFIRDSMTLALNAKIDEETRAKIHAAMDQITKLQDGLFHTQQQLLSLQQDNDSLRKQLASVANWEERASKYKLIRAIGNAMVYEFLEQPHHFACPVCFENEKISILQDGNSRHSGT